MIKGSVSAVKDGFVVVDVNGQPFEYPMDIFKKTLVVGDTVYVGGNTAAVLCEETEKIRQQIEQQMKDSLNMK